MKSYKFAPVDTIPQEAPTNEDVKKGFKAQVTEIGKAVYLFVASSGLRKGEILALKKEEVRARARAPPPKTTRGEIQSPIRGRKPHPHQTPRMQQQRHQPRRPTPPQHELHNMQTTLQDPRNRQEDPPDHHGERHRTPPAIITRAKVEAQREYEETARRMRKETK